MKTKLKIVKNRHDVTDEEIRSYMDFDSLINKHMAQKKTLFNGKHVAAIVAVVSVIAWVTFVVWPDAPVTDKTELRVQDEIVGNTADKKRPAKTSTSPTDEEAHTEYINKESESAPAQPITQKTEKIVKDDNVSESDYHEAEPTAGYQNLYEYFASELRYPADALKDSIQGIVTVSFLIDKSGKPTRIEILNSLGRPFDKEAIRLIENMPTWKPATLNGKPVAAKISMPLTFQIVKSNSENK